MPTVVDSLVLELGLDPKKFVGGQKEISASLKKLIEESRRGGVETEKRSRDIGDNIANLKREAMGLITIFLGGKGVKEFFGYVTSLDAATGRFAKTLDMSSQEVSAWEGVIKGVGGASGAATSALSGMSMEVQKFLLTGQGAFLPLLNSLNVALFKQNGQLKTSAELYLEIADAIKKRPGGEGARAAAMLGMLPGMNPDMLNALMLGRPDVEQRLAKARATVPSDADVKAAQQFQESSANLERSATALGRAVTNLVSGPLTAALDSLTRLVQGWLGIGTKTPEQSHEGLRRRFGEPPAWAKKMTGETGGKRGPSIRDQEAYIRQAAAARGIDPDTAVAVAKREGLYNWKSTVPGEESYGPFQLHYGGRGQRGGLAASGLGDDFTKQTGLDAADPANWRQGVDFALDAAKRQGWGAWYGWKGAKWHGIPGRGAIGAGAAAAAGSTSMTTNAGDTSTSTVSVGQITISTQATDAEGIARDIAPALRRQTLAAPANHGQE